MELNTTPGLIERGVLVRSLRCVANTLKWWLFLFNP
jgi:hypothetical protein